MSLAVLSSGCKGKARQLTPILSHVARYASPAEPQQHQAQAWKRPQTDLDKKKEKKKVQRGTRNWLFRPLTDKDLGKNPLFQAGQAKSLSLPEFEPTRKNIGKAATFGPLTEGPLRYFGLPRSTMLEYRLLSQPCSVVRNVTVAMAELMNNCEEMSSEESRYILTGPTGCGKSFLLMQAAQYCWNRGWIVWYFPRASSMVDCTTAYTYNLSTQTYLQPTYAFQTLQRFQSTNSKILRQMTTTVLFESEKGDIQPNTPLNELIKLGTKNPVVAPQVLEHVMEEVGTQDRFPVLIAVDEVQSLYGRSLYRDPHFQPIQPYHLSTPRLILEYMSGMRLLHSGAVLGSIRLSDPRFPVPLELLEALPEGEEGSLPTPHFISPFARRRASISPYTSLAALQSINVPHSLTMEEAASVFEIWMRNGAITVAGTDETFISKYSESSGIARDFVWKGLLGSLVAARPAPDANSPWPHIRLA